MIAEFETTARIKRILVKTVNYSTQFKLLIIKIFNIKFKIRFEFNFLLHFTNFPIMNILFCN